MHSRTSAQRRHLRNSEHLQAAYICAQLCVPGALHCRRGEPERGAGGGGTQTTRSQTLNGSDNMEGDAENEEGEASLDTWFWSPFSTNIESGSAVSCALWNSYEEHKNPHFAVKLFDHLPKVTDCKQKRR